jgi:adenylate cyclase
LLTPPHDPLQVGSSLGSAKCDLAVSCWPASQAPPARSHSDEINFALWRPAGSYAPSVHFPAGCTQPGAVLPIEVGRFRANGVAESALKLPFDASGPVSRRLLAVMAADVVGYSRLTELDEEDTHCRLRSLRVGSIDPCIVSYRGHVIKNTGDGFLASFDSPLDAVRCAIAIQRDVDTAQIQEAPDRKILFRIGINVGDTIIEPDDIYGVGVNIAARLQEHASAGGILISNGVFEQIGSRLDAKFHDLGSLRLKNMSKPVRAYSISLPGADRPLQSKRSRLRGRARVPSLAVLPFRSQGSDRGGDYFGPGMVEDIIVTLQSIRGLLVISRTSTLSYTQDPFDPGRIGQELGVRYILHGSVRRANSKLRITAELIDVERDVVIWADRYDGDLVDLFDFQTRIATRIVWSITPRVREAELQRATRKRPNNMNAYDLVMEAIDLMYRMDFQDFARAGRLLQDAIVADENYATAYAYAALWHIHCVAQGWGTDRVDSAEAARLASQAVERDPADGFALAIFGHTKSLLFRDYSTAASTFEHALSASPSNAMAWTLSSGVYAYTGQGKIAVARAEQGLRLSPVDAQLHFYLSFLSLAHYVNGTLDEGLIWARKAAMLNPRLCANLRSLTATLISLGRVPEAREAGAALLRVQPRFRVSEYAERCPFEPGLRSQFTSQLVEAGLPV